MSHVRMRSIESNIAAKLLKRRSNCFARKWARVRGAVYSSSSVGSLSSPQKFSPSIGFPSKRKFEIWPKADSDPKPPRWCVVKNGRGRTSKDPFLMMDRPAAALNPLTRCAWKAAPLRDGSGRRHGVKHEHDAGGGARSKGARMRGGALRRRSTHWRSGPTKEANSFSDGSVLTFGSRTKATQKQEPEECGGVWLIPPRR